MDNQEPKIRKSIYPPIEVVLNEEKYQSRKFTHPLNLEIAPLIEVIDAEAPDEGDDIETTRKKWDAYCRWAFIVFGAEKETLEDTEMAEIEDAYMIVKTELLKRQGARMEKHVGEIKVVTGKIEKATGSVNDIKITAEEIAKNVKGPGKKE